MKTRNVLALVRAPKSSGYVCATVAGGKACSLATSVDGGGGSDGGGDRGTAGPIRIGMSAPESGQSGDLGIQMKRGINAWFTAKNATGGVHGQMLQLVDKDDQYDPDKALANTYSLLDIAAPNPADGAADGGLTDWMVPIQASQDALGPNRVLAMFGNVGTPTMLRSAPVCVRNHVVLFGPFTGAATIIRDANWDQYIFNFRASYFDETAAMVAYLKGFAQPAVADSAHVLAFAQNDGYGDQGYEGLLNAWGLPPTSTDIFRVNYSKGNLASVDSAVAAATDKLQTMANAVSASPTGSVGVGIVMVPTYEHAARFVKGIIDWQHEVGQPTPSHPERRVLALTVMSVSFVGADALLLQFAPGNAYAGTYLDLTSGATRAYGDGVWVTEVVPYYNGNQTGVTQHRKDLAVIDSLSASWGSLEGYLAARLFTKGLDAAQSLGADDLVGAYQSLANIDLGIGFNVSFSSMLPGGHQASKNVWFSRIKINSQVPQGGFALPYAYDGTAIQTMP